MMGLYFSVKGDDERVWSRQRGQYVSIDDVEFSAWKLAGMSPPYWTALVFDTESDLIAHLRSLNVPPYHAVKSYRIVRRLEEAGRAEQALAIIDAPQNAVLKARFYTIDSAGGIPADDLNARALIIAAGADPDVILAPEFT